MITHIEHTDGIEHTDLIVCMHLSDVASDASRLQRSFYIPAKKVKAGHFFARIMRTPMASHAVGGVPRRWRFGCAAAVACGVVRSRQLSEGAIIRCAETRCYGSAVGWRCFSGYVSGPSYCVVPRCRGCLALSTYLVHLEGVRRRDLDRTPV